MVSVGIVSLLGCSAARKDTSPTASRFAVVEGVKLHYLDWGGKGEALIFIAGTGDTAHAFDDLAPRFTDHFRVLALTRRGFGESDRPSSGYDIPTLTEDVRGVLDDQRIERANFVCHSAGGDEVTLFASTYPQRTGKLVYLDAAYDRSSIRALEAADPIGADVPGSVEQALHWKGMDAFKPDFTRLRGPVLAIYATYPARHWAVTDKTPGKLADDANHFMETVIRPYQQRNIKQFERDVPHARVIVLDDTDHYFFEDPKLRDSVVATMRAFLIDQK
jgi:pimeloyl-ACP methyl ester carboxylesterase